MDGKIAGLKGGGQGVLSTIGLRLPFIENGLKRQSLARLRSTTTRRRDRRVITDIADSVFRRGAWRFLARTLGFNRLIQRGGV